jgi:cysteine synthase B
MEPKKLLVLGIPPGRKVNLIKNKNVKLLLKLEGNNPGGSANCVAYNMIVSALERATLKGDKLIEATSETLELHWL